MICLNCRHGQHEVPFAKAERCHCICHEGGSTISTIKALVGFAVVIGFCLFMWWATAKII